MSYGASTWACSHKPSVLILKHAKEKARGERRTMRGAKGWRGLVDQTLFQIRMGGRPRKDGLARTRIVPDKTRAFGLSRTIYIEPTYIDEEKTGLTLEGSYRETQDDRRDIEREEEE